MGDYTMDELFGLIKRQSEEIERLRSEIKENELIVRGASRATEEIGLLRGLLREIADYSGDSGVVERVREALEKKNG